MTDPPGELRVPEFGTDEITDEISGARKFASDLIDRLVRTAGPGEHLVMCVTRKAIGVPGLHAGLAISRVRGSAAATLGISGREQRRSFCALLMFGHLARQPIGLIMRTCDDGRHEAAGHRSVIRGWAVRDGRAQPMSQATIRNVAGGGLGPHPCLPPHPLRGTRYESAYSLAPVK